ncbi:maltose ABC transporter substrate-binding protein [Anaerocolumna xylanovorans]|uniref:Carbohydrate ABC transporter substrate-binding protein, CUT1 family n=1 Tax=Anaerocolumna xylanovorans DSM 12503 TaxID=1121345 RepID=A0A1M7XX01_9FIRM|nr:maltose ABC transporter substrate-binding protein [Anaerocolumna xylanovorans]SHO43370.1 carbohydrate ABC transporter substrate-binding protein, CUT1 family [Anaerocolumna xylanovorans DSM 12503]
MKKTLSLLLIVTMIAMLGGCKRQLPPEEAPANQTTADTKTTDTNTSDTKATDAAATAPGDEDTALVPEEGAKLLFWTGDLEFGKAVAEKFQAKYNVPVTVEEVGLGAIDKISLSGPAGTGADVFMSPHDSFQHGVSAGLFLPLEDSVAGTLTERVNEVGIKTVTSDGKLYGVPVSLETSCLFYNKDIVGDEPAGTLEEIMEKAKSFNNTDKNEFYFLSTIGDGYKIYPFLSAEGFRLFGKDGLDNDNPGFDTDEFEGGLDLIKQLHDIVPVSSTDLGNVSFLRSQFEDGKVAYEISGPWDIKEFKSSGVNFGVTSLPTYKGKPMTPFAGVQNAHVSAFSKYPKAAQLLAQFLVSDEGAELLYEKANKITTLKDVSNIKGLQADEYITPFVDQFANSYPMPSVQRISFYWTISAGVCQAVFDGTLTPEEGREKAVSDWKTMLTTE